MSVGIPSSFTQMSNAASLIAVNTILATFGTAAVAAFGLYIRIESLVIMPIIGISIGLVTMVGLYAGSGQYDKLRQVYSYTNKLNILIMSIAAVLFFFGAGLLMGIFTDSPEVIAIGVQAVYFLVITLPFGAISITTSSAFQGMGRGIPALAINLLRVMVLIIPLAYILALVLDIGITGVWLAFVISSPITSLISYTWFRMQKFGK
jgi:Na+-driven multidrug efflux pump